MNALLLKHHERMKLSSVFQKTFNKPLSRYLHPMFGFDIIKFDQDIQTPDGISCLDHVAAKYGVDAVKVIEALI